MIPVHIAPKIEPDRRGGWQLTLFVGDVFDFDIPFRRYLDQVIVCLGGPEAAVLRLPPWEKDEDCIEGTLEWRGREVAVYFEYSLAFLDFSSADRAVLEDLYVRIRPVLRTE